MIQYIIRRSLYAIPIIIGINLLVFFLFFFVYSPDKIAKRHLGQKAHSQEQIEDWKREHNYHLPLIYHNGYDSITFIENRIDSRNGVLVSSDYITPGNYFIDIEVQKGKTSPCLLLIERVDPSIVEGDKSRNIAYTQKINELSNNVNLKESDLTKIDRSKDLKYGSKYLIDLQSGDKLRFKLSEVFEKGKGLIAYLTAIKSPKGGERGNAKVKLKLSKLQIDYVKAGEFASIGMVGGQSGKNTVAFIDQTESKEYYVEFDSKTKGPDDFYFMIAKSSEEQIKKYTETKGKINDSWIHEYNQKVETAIEFSEIKDNTPIINQLYHVTLDNKQLNAYKRLKLSKKDVQDTSLAVFSQITDNTTYEEELKITLSKAQTMEFVGHIQQTILFQKGLQLLWFNFGKSDTDKIPIGYQIKQRMWPSLSLTIPMFILGLLVCITISMIVAFYRGSYIDITATVLCVFGMSISSLFYIILGQIFFAEWLKIFPVSGYDSSFFEIWRFVAMPVIIGVIMGMGGSIRFYRTLFLEEIGRDYIRTARAKGLSEAKVLFKHGLKNTMIPILTSVVMTIPFLFMGSFLFETFFSIPGLGSFTIEAILSNDFSVVRSMVYISSLLYIVGLILTDISYVIVDPRIKFS